MQSGQFDNKVVLVTGAANGIGAVTAKAFAEQGAILVLSDIDTDGQTVADDIIQKGGRASFVSCDVSDPKQVSQLFTAIDEMHGKLDIAFNNAGIDIESSKLADTEEAIYNKIMDINVKGVWLCMQQELKRMQESGGGAIVNTASIAGLGAAPTMGVYCASKHAVIGLTKSAAIEYGKKQIRVNAVCPAVIETDMYRRAVANDPKKALAISKLHPVGRVGQPEEIAAAVLYLSSDISGFTTGVALPVDGGSTAI